MTNEEKAIEIGKRHKIEYISGLKNNDGTSFIECVCSAKEMAEWKDAQFKEYLDKKKSEYGIDYIVNPIDMLNEIINELFGGE